MNKIKIILSIVLMIQLNFQNQLTAQFLPDLNEGGSFKNRGQRLEEKADKLFNDLAFIDALKSYQLLEKNNPESPRYTAKIAECYHEMRMPEKAVEQFKKASENGYIFSKAKQIHYAENLMQIKSYDSAERLLKRIQNGSSEKIDKVDRYLEDLKTIEKLTKEERNWQVTNLAINSKFADFSPTYFDNGIVFVSNRRQKILGKKFAWDDTSFLDLYFAEEVFEGNLVEASPWYVRLNSKYHEGPIAIDPQDSSVYFTRNNYFKKEKKTDSTGVIRLKIYHAVKNERLNTYQGQLLSFNSDDFSCAHPTLDPSGEWMYFASDRPGGYGGSDIYKVQKLVNGWGIPVNLGEKVNTSGNELFPYFRNDSILFFASNGHGGLGGLDIYQTPLDEIEVQNLGAPLNSESDDFGIIFEPENEKEVRGYFTSNRKDGKGDDDIYSFKSLIPPSPKIKGVVINKLTLQPINKADVFLFKDDELIKQVQSDEDGKFKFDLDWDHTYTVKTEKEFYTKKQLTLNTNNYKISNNSLRLPLEKRDKIIGYVKNNTTNEGIPNVDVSYEIGKVTEQTKTNESGQYEIPFKHCKELPIFYSKTKFFNTSKSLEYCDKENLPDIYMDEIVLNKEIKIDNIYFDLNKSDIRPDAAIELNKLVKTLKENPTIVIEFGSHTDSRGSDSYNRSLSDRRAKSSAKYIIEQGIPASRIKGKGYGESKLVNKCKNGIKCTEEQHEQNRRTVFKVLEY